MPFAALLDVRIIDASVERIVATTRWAPDRCTRGGVLHGGFLMAVADATGTACATFHLTGGSRATTVESQARFIRSVRDGELIITASPVRVSPTTIVVQTDIIRCDGRLVATITQTLAVRS